jgi:hypothetical protein
VTEPVPRCGDNSPWPGDPTKGCIRAQGHSGWHVSPGGIEWNWSQADDQA